MTLTSLFDDDGVKQTATITPRRRYFLTRSRFREFVDAAARFQEPEAN